MRCNFLADPAFSGIFSDHQPNRLFCIPASSVIYKEISALLNLPPVGCVITSHHIQNLSVCYLNISFLIPFSRNSQHSRGQINAVCPDIRKLINSDPCCKESLYNGNIPYPIFIFIGRNILPSAVHIIQKLFDIFSRYDPRESDSLFELDLYSPKRALFDVFFFLKMGIERFYTCKLSFHCFLLILFMQIGNILLYPWLARIRAGAEFEELAQIDSIGFQGLVVDGSGSSPDNRLLFRMVSWLGPPWVFEVSLT